MSLLTAAAPRQRLDALARGTADPEPRTVALPPSRRPRGCTAYLALVTGILGIVSITGWNVTVIMNAIVATVWVLLVGYRLYRLGQR